MVYQPGAPGGAIESPGPALASLRHGGLLRAGMSEERTQTDYKSAPPEDKSGREASGEASAVEDWLNRLARAVRQCHTYPITSPICLEALTACHQALMSLDSVARISFRVAPHELILEDTKIGGGTIIEQEIARRLHRANVAAFSVDRAASVRDLMRFCEDLVRSEAFVQSKTTLADLLLEHGVDAVCVEMAHLPEVLDLGIPRAPLLQLVETERRRRQAIQSGGPVGHLYPPDKGWVRLDPTNRLGTVSLVDLAILVDDPVETATLLLRLTDDDSDGGQTREAALEQKFNDVANLFSSMEPQLARVMFAKLARAVLNLEPGRREALLRRTILPGLLDGEPSGAVLRDFEDVDLAESLCLLLDLETAAPEVLATALERLDLPSARRDGLVPLLEARLQARKGSLPERARPDSSVDEYTRRLIRVGSPEARNLAEFSAFDLSIDRVTSETLVAVGEAVSVKDVVLTELRCLSSLVKLEPSPGVARALLDRAVPLLGSLHRSHRWSDLTSQIADYGRVATQLGASRPDVAEAVTEALTRFWTPDRARRVANMHGADGPDRRAAAQLVESSGATLAHAMLQLIEESAGDQTDRGVVALICEHAKLFAPALVATLEGCSDRKAHVLVRALGFAGPGYEKAVASQLDRRDEQGDREALRALVRIGSARAAAVVADHLMKGRAGAKAAAEEALWHFPPAQIAAQVRDLLAHRDFVRQHPDIAARLLDRAAQSKPAGLDSVLTGLMPFRFWFWNPSLVRVSRKARVLLAR